MRFLAASHTDIGISKKINQDAFAIKIAKAKKHNIAFAILCDGMGGLNNGEYASAVVVNTFCKWFYTELPGMVETQINFEVIQKRWNEIILELGSKLMNYGAERNISLGTTTTAILIIDNQYICGHVGDSRLYRMDQKITQITSDHTVVAREVEQHRMTVDEAKVDGRKNVLLQCVGASKVITPEFRRGTVAEGDVFMLCSDGFRHEISDEEIYGVLAPNLLTSEKIMKRSLVDLIELNKERNEKDNITSLVIKAIR